MLNIQLIDYFARLTAVREFGPVGLKALRSANLAVVGTGGVGSAAAYFLASLGVGHLKLIDQDIVEETNLYRLIGIDHHDLHLPKAEALARKLSIRHPWTEAKAIVETLRRENCEKLLGNADLIIDGTDNFRARRALNRFAVKSKVPYLFTSAIANQGHLSLFNTPETPCLECLMPETTADSAESCEILGVTPTIVGIVGNLAATEATKRILGLPTRILGHLLTIDLAGPDFVYNRIPKRENCRVCDNSVSSPVHGDNVVMLCGDNVANVLPQEDMAVDLQSLEGKIPQEQVVARSESVFVYTKPPHRISVFRTGRLLIGNVETEQAAMQVAREVWNDIL